MSAHATIIKPHWKAQKRVIKLLQTTPFIKFYLNSKVMLNKSLWLCINSLRRGKKEIRHYYRWARFQIKKGPHISNNTPTFKPVICKASELAWPLQIISSSFLSITAVEFSHNSQHVASFVQIESFSPAKRQTPRTNLRAICSFFYDCWQKLCVDKCVLYTRGACTSRLSLNVLV